MITTTASPAPAKPLTGGTSSTATTDNDVAQADPALPHANTFSCQQMSIAIAGPPERDQESGNNIAESDTDSDMDWPQGPGTPGTESEGESEGANDEDHAEPKQNAPPTASWAGNCDGNITDTSDHRFSYEPLIPAPLNTTSARLPSVQYHDMYEDEIEHEHDREPEKSYRARLASGFPCYAAPDRIPTPYHRESPREQTSPRMASRSQAPHLLTPSLNPFSSIRCYPGETEPSFRPREPNPFAARPPSRQPESYYYGCQPLEMPMSPAPAIYRRSPSPPRPPVRLADAFLSPDARDAQSRRFGLGEDELAPAPAPFMIRAPSIGSANESRTGAPSATTSDTATQNSAEHQRQIQKFVGLLTDMVHNEVRNVAKTVLELTNDLHDMHEDVANLRLDMERFKEERRRFNAIKNGNNSSNVSIPTRPFSTHYYPGNYNSSPRPSFYDRSDEWSSRQPTAFDPISEHSDAGSHADDKFGRDWDTSGPESIHEYLGAHDFGRNRYEQDNDSQDSRASYDSRGIRKVRLHPLLAGTMGEDDDHLNSDGRDGRDARDARDARDSRDSRDNETLLPYTYRFDEPLHRGSHAANGNSSRFFPFDG